MTKVSGATGDQDRGRAGNWAVVIGVVLAFEAVLFTFSWWGVRLAWEVGGAVGVLAAIGGVFLLDILAEIVLHSRSGRPQGMLAPAAIGGVDVLRTKMTSEQRPAKWSWTAAIFLCIAHSFLPLIVSMPFVALASDDGFRTFTIYALVLLVISHAEGQVAQPIARDAK
ncbi:MAG: hypothetical protein QM750_19640 [Rubrivivax sp.]